MWYLVYAISLQKNFVHYYNNEGINESDFIDTESNMNNLVFEYMQYQHASIEDENEDYDDEKSAAER